MTVGFSYSETSDMICHTNQHSCKNCSGWFPDDILGSSNFYDDTIKIEKFSMIFRSTILIWFSDRQKGQRAEGLTVCPTFQIQKLDPPPGTDRMTADSPLGAGRMHNT
jgi:hypothetical protein